MSRKFGLPGKVFFIEIATSSDSLSPRALNILQQAEVVLHGETIPSDVLQRIRKSTVVLDVSHANSQQISERMIAYADDGKVVVRLRADKSLTPEAVQEEAQALREAAIEVEVLSALATAVAAA
ncbi:MAG: SAM-dependent methyltransferase [Candidatus Acidiferrum sp.]